RDSYMFFLKYPLHHYKEFCEEIFYNIELEKITQN
ncbi:hypothetical protein ACNG2B_001806, partial [Campylobacter jejuni]